MRLRRSEEESKRTKANLEWLRQSEIEQGAASTAYADDPRVSQIHASG